MDVSSERGILGYGRKIIIGLSSVLGTIVYTPYTLLQYGVYNSVYTPYTPNYYWVE